MRLCFALFLNNLFLVNKFKIIEDHAIYQVYFQIVFIGKTFMKEKHRSKT